MIKISSKLDNIKVISVESHTILVKEKYWRKFYETENEIENIFNGKDAIKISRKEIIDEKNSKTRILKTLMWGYPKTRHSNNIKAILERIETVEEILQNIKDKNLSRNEAEGYIQQLFGISGLGMSTCSKFLYFFGVSIDQKKCLIFDRCIVSTLNPPFSNFILDTSNTWERDLIHYYDYINKVNEVSSEMNVTPDQVELFLFNFAKMIMKL